MQQSHPPSPFSPIAFTFPSIRVFSNESDLPIRWPKYWSFSFSFSPSSEYSGLIYLRLIGFTSLLAKGPSRVFSSTKYGEQPFFMVQLSHLYMTTGKTTALTIWTPVSSQKVPQQDRMLGEQNLFSILIVVLWVVVVVSIHNQYLKKI